ncbi:unnamed protein product [marine sediment metagenome]|uniref:DNA (cytosine-5-)-methyltransferase n=1 Tax=marine sediment metagenome TaxID=412755 RepID=X0ZG67_9ZZZZ
MVKILNLYAGIGGNRKLWGDVKGCGKDIKVYFNSEKPQEGFDIIQCGKGITCEKCSLIEVKE